MAAILVPSSPQPPLPLFSGLPILLSLVKSGLAANKKASVVGIVAASAAAVAGVALFLVNRNLNSRYAIPGYSRTAEIACLARAISHYDANPRYRTKDYLAEYFVSWHMRMIVRLMPGFMGRMAERKVRCGLSWMIARTHIYDHIVESTLVNERDVTQVVILGAGFDSRFYRLYIPTDRTIKLIEVDQRPTQNYKRQLLSAIPPALIRRNHAVSYLSVDFERQSLQEALLSSSEYDPKKKTLFLWEAVVSYLTQEAVEHVVEFVKQYSAAGSILAFDVRYKEAIDGSKRYKMGGITSYVSRVGESFKFGIPEGQVRQWVLDHGLDLHAFYGPPQFSEYVTTDEPNGFSYDVPDVMDLVVARVRSQPI